MKTEILKLVLAAASEIFSVFREFSPEITNHWTKEKSPVKCTCHGKRSRVPEQVLPYHAGF
jgi:hypothetical protein